ncbi:uncharacterized protein LOC141897094 [Acropora palmata]|uniref:uncharacterized protein LOC141897094 n=1 Tax=Acropora palmata TaxID=6131 RepID=UPI003DA0AB79
MAERGRKRRKRRDSTTHIKPPLDFIESPINGQKYYCTPVQAARRPFLASSFPVDEKEALKWVSPQFPSPFESDELLQPRKTRGRRKKQDPTQVNSVEPSANKPVFTALQFEHENQIMKTNCKDTNDRKENSQRRSQRMRLKELKKTHFLFQIPPGTHGTIPLNMKEEIVLASETPDHELVMLRRRKERKSKR